jgi:hypothetical protein
MKMFAATIRTSGFLMLVLCLFGPGPARAQAPEAADEEVIDEVLVYGQKSMLVLRRELLLAEEKFVNTYNDLNENDTLDIVCINEAPTGSKIVRRTCLPQYRWDERQNDSMDFLRNAGMAPPTTRITVMPDDTELLENMQLLAREHSQLLESLMDYQDKISEFRTERERRRSEDE